jgi:hypothetical protein
MRCPPWAVSLTDFSSIVRPGSVLESLSGGATPIIAAAFYRGGLDPLQGTDIP